jgi:hypothetical protein
MAETYKCSNCGSQVPLPSDRCSNCNNNTTLTWETDITLLSNPLFVKQLALVTIGAGLLMAFLLAFIFAATGEFDAIPMMVLISFLSIVGLGVLLFLVTLVFFGNRTSVRFTVDEKGAYWETIDKRAKTLNRLTILVGILGRSPQTAGAGTLAAAREKEFFSWSQLSLVEESRRHLMITLRNSWRPVMMLICLPENFDTVLKYVSSRVERQPATKAKGPKPFVKGLKRTIFVCLAIAPLFYLSSPYVLDYDIFMTLIVFFFTLATVWLVPLFGWVVIASGVIVAIQVLFSGISDFSFLYGHEQLIFILSFLGLAYLFWFSWSSIKGKILPPLIED